MDVPYSETERINSIKGLKAEIYNTSYLYRLDLNTDHEPLDNVDVRHALSFAINRDEIVKYVLFGVGSPESVPFNSAMPWANLIMSASILPDKIVSIPTQGSHVR